MAFSPQSFSSGQVLTAAQLNQTQANITAVRTHHAGNSAPGNLTEGVIWLDTSVSSEYIAKYYDGSSWISLWIVNPITHTASFFSVPPGSPAQSITAAKIASGSLLSDNFANACIQSYHLAQDNSITGIKVDSGAVTAAKVASGTLSGLSTYQNNVRAEKMNWSTGGVSGSGSAISIALPKYCLLPDIRGSTDKAIYTASRGSISEPAFTLVGASGTYDIDYRYISS